MRSHPLEVRRRQIGEKLVLVVTASADIAIRRATCALSRRPGFNTDAAVADEAAGSVEHRLPAHPVLLSRAIGIDAAELQID